MANSEGSLIPSFVCSKISKINSARLFEKERSFRIVRRKRWNGALGSGQVSESATKFDGDEDKPASFPVPRPDSRKFKNTFSYFPKPPDDRQRGLSKFSKNKKEKNVMNLSPESSFDSFDEDFFKKKEHQTSWLCILLTTGRF